MKRPVARGGDTLGRVQFNDVLQDIRRRLEKLSRPGLGSGAAGASGVLTSVRRFRILLYSACLLGAVAGYLYERQKTPTFQATAKVYVRDASVASQINGATNGQNTNRLVATLAELVNVPEVLNTAATAANLSKADRDRLNASVTATTSIDSDLINIATTWGDAPSARSISNAVAQAFIDYRRELDIGPLRQAEKKLADRIKVLRASGTDTAVLRALTSKQVDLQSNILLGSGNSILAPAGAANRIGPRPKLWFAIGGLLGLLGGAALVMMLSQAEGRRVRNGDELSELLGTRVLARVPLIGASDAPRVGPLMLSAPNTRSAEGFWTLLASLDLIDPLRDKRVILVVGATIEDGASTVAMNLAVAEASAGRSVALCDFDLRHPAIAAGFGLSPYGEGISALLAGRLQIDDASQKIPLLSGSARDGASAQPENPRRESSKELIVVPSGPPVPNSGGLLAGEAVGGLLGLLRARHDRVYLDSSPWLAGGDTIALSRWVDAILVVSRVGQSTRASMVELRRWLDQGTTPVLGAVLNGTPSASADVGEDLLLRVGEVNRSENAQRDFGASRTETSRL